MNHFLRTDRCAIGLDPKATGILMSCFLSLTIRRPGPRSSLCYLGRFKACNWGTNRAVPIHARIHWESQSLSSFEPVIVTPVIWPRVARRQNLAICSILTHNSKSPY